ncbi:diguanylate cyclase [Herminiimonas sp. NPDC097707]|uniref:diguanylate cyclase n=1 Tax=Herminiimonas sp. NPDC097707 TaxID=3364007 RepID=UPI00383BF69E
MLKAERNRFGSGHDEVGYWLLKRWGIPEHLSLACIASHADTSGHEAQATPLTCVATSGYFADVFLKGDHAMQIVAASEAAARWLCMDACTTIAMLEKMREQMQEFEALFDMRVLQTDQVDALLQEAKELITIANLGRQRELEEKTHRDVLTGAHNRRYFDEAFKDEFAVASRQGWPLSVAFIDIDHFKQVNDSYGHAAGDKALIALSRIIAYQIRGSDIFVRYGGEEFVLLFPGTAAEEALIVLTRIRQAVASYCHTYDTATFHLTISAGLAFHMDEDMKHETAEGLLRAADSALYTAKQNGRNQIIKSKAK